MTPEERAANAIVDLLQGYNTVEHTARVIAIIRAAVAAEREACAEIAYREEMELNQTHHAADKIRARGQTENG